MNASRFQVSRGWRLALVAAAWLGFGIPATGQDAAPDSPAALTPAAAKAALRQAAGFYREQVAVHGGYVYYYSLDLKRRLGEGVATPTQVWVQPPGTPTVGLAFLAAYRATSDPYYLAAATEAAEALVYGQLKSGGWTNQIDFDPAGSGTAAYRNGRGRGKDNSTLDDGITQGALLLLTQVDAAQKFQHAAIHEAAVAGLTALLQAQYLNGGFPQVWTGPVAPHPAYPASFPDYDWKTEQRVKEYWNLYTLNDGLAGNVAATLRTAWKVYDEPRYRDALLRLGDFLISAQLPDPQPAWAQQYTFAMRPAWARRFEPPAVAGRESQDVVRTLLDIYVDSGNQMKYLAPIPRALAYLEKSQLKDGQLARYYELQTNRPLYMNRNGRDYFLTYDDTDLPSHYGWKVESEVAALRARYEQLMANPALDAEKFDENAALEALQGLDRQGRWISRYDGAPLVGQPKLAPREAYLSSEVFSQNLEALAAYLEHGARSK